VTGFVSSDPLNFDPAAIAGWDQGVIAPNLLEGLFRLSPDGREIEPAVAESFEVSDDGKTWTFNLRAGAKFHNGREITADDFKYSFERVLNPETRSPKAWMLSVVVGAQEFQDGAADEVSGIRVVDTQTLEIELAEPLAPFKSMLASINLAVVPQEEVEKWGEDFGQNVVSAGPFSLGEWNLNQDVTLNAFEDYWNGRPFLDAVMFRFIGDENTRIIELDAGRLDMAWVPPAHWERFSTDPVYKEKLGWAETFHTDFIAVNLENEPFGTNPKLRQAVRYALDLDAIIASLQGRATVAQGLLPPGLLGFDEDAILSYPTNLDSAKALMAEAGFADGVPGTFEVILPPWGNLIKMLEIYQANLKEIGINIEIRPTEFGPYMEALESGNYDLAWMYRVTDYADPDGFYFPLMHSDNLGAGGNYARYANADVDANIATARATIDDAERARLYQAVDAQFAEDLPYIPLTHNIYVDVSLPRVQNYVPSPMDTHMFHRVWVEE
jgi:peptide/nickel transport system substrate-binding protein/oligopeptide transport system substrate-binding protein